MAEGSSSSHDKVVLNAPSDQLVPVGLDEVCAALRGLSQDPTLWQHVARCLAGLIAVEHSSRRRRAIGLFTLFSLCASRSYLHSAVIPEASEFDVGEQQFLQEFTGLLLDARFRLHTIKEQQMAERDAFQFNTPIHVDWKQLDDKLLTTFWNSTPAHQALRKRLPSSVDRVLVMHRGVGVVRARGVYLWRKLDLLLLYCLHNAVSRIAKALHLAQSGWSVVPETDLSGSSSAGNGGQASTHGAEDKCSDASNPPAAADRDAQVAREVRVSNWHVECKTLRSMLPGAGAVLRQLFAVMELQEPTFEEVVVLYRAAAIPNWLDVLAAKLGATRRSVSSHAADNSSATAAEADTAPSPSNTPSSNASYQHKYTVQALVHLAITAVLWAHKQYSRAVLAIVGLVKAYCGSRACKPCNVPFRRNIYIKSYNDVPIADMELVLPFKQVHIRPNHAIQLFATFAAAVGSVVLVMREASHQQMGEYQIAAAMWALTWVLVARSLQLWGDLQSRTTKLNQGMAELQNDKAGSTQEGVISKLVDGMADDVTKEVLLCYSLLVEAGRPVQRSELAAMCQRFLQDHFMLQSDFSGRSVLQLLMDWGLVQEHVAHGEPALLQAVPLAAAHAILLARWHSCMASTDVSSASAGSLQNVNGTQQQYKAHGAGDDAGATTSDDPMSRQQHPGDWSHRPGSAFACQAKPCLPALVPRHLATASHSILAFAAARVSTDSRHVGYTSMRHQHQLAHRRISFLHLRQAHAMPRHVKLHM